MLLASNCLAGIGDGVVAWYPLDGTAADASGNNLNGTVYGAGTTSAPSGTGLWFDGSNDYVALPDNNPIWLPQNDFSLSFWVRFDREPGLYHEVLLDLNCTASYSPDNRQGYGVQMTLQHDGHLLFMLMDDVGSEFRLTSSDPVLIDDWYHIVAIRNGTTQSFYIDGAFDISGPCSGDPIDFVGGYDDDNVSLARWTTSGNPNYFFRGGMDDLRIYDRALTPDEVAELYSIPEPATGILLLIGGMALRRKRR
jgi:hypothetical protein